MPLYSAVWEGVYQATLTSPETGLKIQRASWQIQTYCVRVGTLENHIMTLSRSQQLIIAGLLALLMFMTRGHHFASVDALPSASWAIFFLAGLYLSSAAWFPVFLAMAAGLDIASVLLGGGQLSTSFCMSPAYGFLIPAYGSLWMAGRWYASKYQFNAATLLPLVGSVLVAATAATLFSGGGFYFFSGRYPDPTFTEYTQRFIQYFPKNLAVMSFYLVVAMICHVSMYFTKTTLQAEQK